MNDELLKIIKEAGFSVSFGNVHVLYDNRQINITIKIKKLIELAVSDASDAEEKLKLALDLLKRIAEDTSFDMNYSLTAKRLLERIDKKE